MSRRWPPRGQEPGPWPGGPGDDPGAAHAEFLARAIGDLSKAVAAMSPAVLQTTTYTFGATGVLGDQFRVPYRALAISSQSNAVLTVTSSPQAAQAPGPGAGIVQVGPYGFEVADIAGNVFSAYGGAPGESITVTAYSRPMPPTGTAGGSAQATQYIAGEQTAPAAGTAIATLPALAAGWWKVAVTAGFGSTAEATTPDNFELALGAKVLYPSLAVAQAVNSLTPVGTFRVLSDGVSQLALKNAAAASAGAIYNGALQADRA